MRKRRRDRRGDEKETYPAPGSALGNPVNAERLAIAFAITIVGELTERERILIIEHTRWVSGYIFDLEESNHALQERLMEMIRLYG